MSTKAFSAVIVVGLAQHPRSKKLLSLLQRRGLDVTQVAGAEELPDVLENLKRAAVVVYSPRKTAAAQRTLAKIAETHRRTPVVVLVDESDFGDYYALMASGAVEYFEIGEQPEVITQGVAWAARSLAS